uniref:Uncharacterized protein n=1 Tax=viral metagenome TaxID=1070528 RepID=A0A6M3KNY1_9ZZZZ
MKTLKVKNLDEVYSLIKSLSGELSVTGWAASYEGVYFLEADTLLGWFLRNISDVKKGVKNLLVASAYGDGKGYSILMDRILLSSEPTTLGLLVVVKVEWNSDNGFHDYSGKYETECGSREHTFLLKYSE